MLIQSRIRSRNREWFFFLVFCMAVCPLHRLSTLIRQMKGKKIQSAWLIFRSNPTQESAFLHTFRCRRIRFWFICIVCGSMVSLKMMVLVWFFYILNCEALATITTTKTGQLADLYAVFRAIKPDKRRKKLINCVPTMEHRQAHMQTRRVKLRQQRKEGDWERLEHGRHWAIFQHSKNKFVKAKNVTRLQQYTG